MRVNEFGSCKRSSFRIPGRPQPWPAIPGNRCNHQNRSRDSSPAPKRDSLSNGSGRRLVQFRPNLLAKRNRRAFTKAAALKNRAQRLLRFQRFGAFPAAFEMAFEFGRPRRVQLAVEVAVQGRPRVITAHEEPPAPELV